MLNQQLDGKISAFLQANQARMFADIDTMLRIDSVTGEPQDGAPLGIAVRDAIDAMLAICAAHGLKTRNIGGMIGEAVWGEGKASLGIITHVDIVPAGSGWTKPPFALTVENGMMVGRGVIDDKGPAVASLWALLAVLDAGAALNRRVVLLFGGDEESGMRCVKRYLETEAPPDMSFSPDGGFPVIFCEKTLCAGVLSAHLPAGSTLLALYGGTRTNVVPGEASALISREPAAALPEKVTADRAEGGWLLTAAGTPAHASTPEQGDNAIVRLLAALEILLPQGDPALQAVSALHRLCAPVDGSGFGIACSDDVSGALTFNLGVIGVEDGNITARFDVRHPVWADAERNMRVLLPETAARAGLAARDITVRPGFCIPRDHVLVRTLMGVYNGINGSSEEPLAIGGGTYARMLPNAAAYGMLFEGDPETAHMANERISVESFMKATRIYANAIAELGK